MYVFAKWQWITWITLKQQFTIKELQNKLLRISLLVYTHKKFHSLCYHCNNLSWNFVKSHKMSAYFSTDFAFKSKITVLLECNN